MKIFLIAGEASGDLHGANLMKALLKKDANINFQFWGGDKMNAISPNIKKHYKDLAFMGFVEVLANIRTIKANFKLCKKQIIDFQPDKVIFIDYPGFNLRMAKWVKEQNIQTIYYIAPQVWAWHKSRVKTIKKYIDQMFVILPFEQEFFKKNNFNVSYVGNPVMDEISNFKQNELFIEKYKLQENLIIAVLPGSREQEISKMLPIMLDITQHYPEMIFCVAVKSTIDPNIYKEAIPSKHSRNIRFVSDDHYNLLSNARAALVTSGTATLETALFNVPQVVCYKGNALTVSIAKKLVNIEFISLVNLILGRGLVTELIQNEFNSVNLQKELDIILADRSNSIQKGYKELLQKIGPPGASEKTAKSILNY